MGRKNLFYFLVVVIIIGAYFFTANCVFRPINKHCEERLTYLMSSKDGQEEYIQMVAEKILERYGEEDQRHYITLVETYGFDYANNEDFSWDSDNPMMAGVGLEASVSGDVLLQYTAGPIIVPLLCFCILAILGIWICHKILLPNRPKPAQN